LVEPSFDILLPVLTEVVVWDDVVTADRHLANRSRIKPLKKRE
jgi:hypothetical protein